MATETTSKSGGSSLRDANLGEADTSVARSVLLPGLLLFGSMFNLTLVVAGLKEFILEDMGGTVAHATLFFSVETIAYIIFAPIWGLASDRWGKRKPLVIVGFALSACIYAAYGIIDSIPVLLAARFVQGAFSVMAWSTIMTMMLDDPLRGRRGRHMGLMGAALIFGVALGAPVGGYLTRWFGPRAPLLAAATLFAALALAAFLLRETRSGASSPRLGEIFRTLRATPWLTFPMLCHFIDRLAVGLFVVVFPLYIDSLGATDPAVRGRYLAYFLIPFALLQVLTGRIPERTGPFPPLLIGSFLYGVTLCFVGFANLIQLGVVMIALGVLASIMFPPAILLTSQLADPRSRGSAMGAFNLAGSVGFAVGPLLGGWAFMTQGYGFAFAVCGILEILLAVVGLFLLTSWPGRVTQRSRA